MNPLLQFSQRLADISNIHDPLTHCNYYAYRDIKPKGTLYSNFNDNKLFAGNLSTCG